MLFAHGCMIISQGKVLTDVMIIRAQQTMAHGSDPTCASVLFARIPYIKISMKK
jgi:hypothetical protein